MTAFAGLYDDAITQMYISMVGMHQATSSKVGWIELDSDGPECWQCEQPVRLFKPETAGRLWWCVPCDVTWITA